MKKWNTYCFLHQYFAFVIVLLGESFRHVNFSFLTSSSWNLFSTLANHSLHPQICHYNGLKDVSWVIPTVMCDVVILVMCAMYWVLQFVHWFCDCYVTKSVKNHLFKIIWDITIKVNAYGCRPENGRIPLIAQWYKLVHFMMTLIVLIIYAYLNLFNFVTSLGEHCTHFCRFIAMDKERLWFAHWCNIY